MSASDAAACFFTGRLYASLVRDRVFGGSVACSLPSPLPSPPEIGAPPGYVMMKLSLNDARSSSLPR